MKVEIIRHEWREKFAERSNITLDRVRYDWPGNVRQLQNAVEHALVFPTSELDELEDLPKVVFEELAVEATRSSFESEVLHTRKAAVECAVQETRGNVKAAAPHWPSVRGIYGI